jgi:hypothetical protein
VVGIAVEIQVRSALVSALVEEGSGIARALRRQQLKAIIVQSERVEKQRGLAVMVKQVVPLSRLEACYWS